MQYVLVDNRDGDIFVGEYETQEEAVKAGEDMFSRFSDYDKKHREEFFVFKSLNPDEDAENHYDGDIVKWWKLRDEF